MNVAAYCRVSTDKSDQLNSLETQKKFFVEYTKKNDYNLVHLYADEGISGTKIKNRTEFLKLMKDAETRLFDMVVVKDISRFARNTVDFLQGIRKLKALGIETVFLTANMTSLGESEFILTIFGALAQEESANTSKRIKFGKRLNAENGRVPNFIYGYDKIIGDYFNLNINEQEAMIVKQIFSWYIDDGYGALKIANKLNEKGYKTKRNCKWTQAGIMRLLSHEIYIGKIINNKEEILDFLTSERTTTEPSEWNIVEKPELRIIDDETFQKAKYISKKRYDAFHMTKERQSNKYLFSTLIKCEECGWSFRRSVRTYKNTYIKWTCSSHNRGGIDSCPNAISIDEDVLIQKIDDYLAEIKNSKYKYTKSILENFNQSIEKDVDNSNSEKELKSKLKKIQNTREKYIEMYTDGLISREELNAKVGGMLEEVTHIENELKLAEKNITKGDILKTNIADMFESLNRVTSIRDLTNAQLKKLIEKIVVDDKGKIKIHMNVYGDLIVK